MYNIYLTHTCIGTNNLYLHTSRRKSYNVPSHDHNFFVTIYYIES